MKEEVITADELWDLIQGLHETGWEEKPYEDEEAIFSSPTWTLIEAQLSDLRAGSYHPPVVAGYARLKTEFPPIVVSDDGFVLDGVHRYYAARLRKDETILAYVPSESTEDVD